MIPCPCCGDNMPSPLLLCETCQKCKTDPAYLIKRMFPLARNIRFEEDAWDKYERECQLKFKD
jgi:hypothetical protein